MNFYKIKVQIGEGRNLRRRGLKGKFIADACEARDGTSEGLESVPTQAPLHSLSLSLSLMRAGTPNGGNQINPFGFGYTSIFPKFQPILFGLVCFEV